MSSLKPERTRNVVLYLFTGSVKTVQCARRLIMYLSALGLQDTKFMVSLLCLHPRHTFLLIFILVVSLPHLN
jgi:hypothetical protein